MDINKFQKLSEPIPITMDLTGKMGRISSSARLQMITSILAMAVLRKKARKTLNNRELPVAKKSFSDNGERLDLLDE